MPQRIATEERMPLTDRRSLPASDRVRSCGNLERYRIDSPYLIVFACTGSAASTRGRVASDDHLAEGVIDSQRAASITR